MACPPTPHPLGSWWPPFEFKLDVMLTSSPHSMLEVYAILIIMMVRNQSRSQVAVTFRLDLSIVSGYLSECMIPVYLMPV